KDGSIIFIYSRYGAAGFEDGCNCDLYATISTDEGENFGEPYPLLLHTDFDAENIMSVSLMRMQNGDIGLFFLKKVDGNCLPYVVRSSDEGKTWHSLTPIFEKKGYYCVNNDRVIRLKSGRILVPACYFEIDYFIDENGIKQVNALRPGELYVFASDDDGVSFKTVTEGYKIPVSAACKTGVQEPGFLELNDGRVWCYIRNDSGRQYQCFSSDEGESWSAPELSRFTSPVSPLSADRLSDGRIIAVWNPIPLYNGRSLFYNGYWTDGRNPLVIAVSDDDGNSFSDYIAIETDESHGYAYTAIFETNDNSILLAYCAGGEGDVHSMLERLRITKLSIDELSQSYDQSVDVKR
ncbi:MAG: exo-alpha-sialidase, partial [Oscillospiraceae bacterium]|nr:exo-alpha-sialidase [Oscillospiraceae bacterium]